MRTQPMYCVDCVEVHGESPTTWLRDCPEGAPLRADHNDTHLCDGCADDRDEADYGRRFDSYSLERF